MLLLSISATGIIFIRKGGGREGGRSRSLRYAPQTNLCFLNYLCQLRFYKLNKSITQVYFEPAGCPGGGVAHLLAHSRAVLWEQPGHSETCVIQFPPLCRTHFGRLAVAPEWSRPCKSQIGAATEGWALPKGKQARAKPPLCTTKQSPKGHHSGDNKKGESNKLGNHSEVRDLLAKDHQKSIHF